MTDARVRPQDEAHGARSPTERRARAAARRSRVHDELGKPQSGVASIAQLREAGITYDQIRAEVSAGRWHRVGRRTISLSGPLPSSDEAIWRRALWDVGGDACLDGASALMAWGLAQWSEDVTHVSVPASVRYHRVDGVRVHVLRNRGVPVSTGVPRMPPETAAIRAATWARTDRAAATLLAMSVQQRLVHPGRLLQAWSRVGRCRRRALLERLVPLVADGAQALSEIDFALLGRERGWLEPDRQVVVRTPRGRVYLDVRFSAYDVIAEVNGVQHYQALARISRAVRDAFAVGG